MKCLNRSFFVAIALLVFPGFAFAARPGFDFQLNGDGVELKLIKLTPNTAKNPTHTRKYSATIKKGAIFTLDLGQYLMGGGLPEPQRVEIAASTGEWKHDERVSANPSVLKGEEFSQPGPTTVFTALKTGKTTLVFELDDRPNPNRKNGNSPTHVVWRFEVEVTVE